MVESAFVVVKPEEKRSDGRRARAVAKSAHDAVGRPHPLDLLHAGPVPGSVSEVQALGDDAVQRAARAAQPLLRHRAVRRGRGKPDAPLLAKMTPRELLELPPSLRERLAGERLALLVHEQVKDDQDGRELLRELPDAALGRMDPLEEIVEGEDLLDRDRDLAIQHELPRRERPNGGDDLREVAGERLAGLRLQLDGFTVLERDAPEAVPLRLVLPVAAFGDLVDEKRLHRRVRRRERQGQKNFSNGNLPLGERRGFQRSPSFAKRAGALSTRKSSMATPFSISSQVTGVETVARGLGRTE